MILMKIEPVNKNNKNFTETVSNTFKINEKYAKRLIKCDILLYLQPAFICSKLTIKTLEQDVKYVQSNNKDTRTMAMASF